MTDRETELHGAEALPARRSDEEATVKRMYRESDHLRLQPENEAMDPILTSDAQVMGKVIGVFRKV